MNNYVAIVILAVVLCSTALCFAQHHEPQVADSLITLHSSEGRRLLRESDADESFWRLVQFSVPQEHGRMCSVATSVAVLNSLPVPRPTTDGIGQFRLFNHDNFFSSSVTPIITADKVRQSGMTLEQLSRVLQTFAVAVDKVPASEIDLAHFRTALNSALSEPNSRLIINYFRPFIGQTVGRGHFSPVAAYNKESDRVLILDTAVYKYPWVWAPVEDVWKAMATVDADSKHTRGYIVVKAAESSARASRQSSENSPRIAEVTDAPPVTATGWAIADGATGKLVWGHRANEQFKAASTAKIMCTYMVLQLIHKEPKLAEEIVTFSEFADRTEGSTVNISAGERITVRDCLYGLLLRSGNDCGNALAEHFNGRFRPAEEPTPHPGAHFIAEMNRVAAQLELTKTSYCLPYSDGEAKGDRTTSPKDLAALAWHAMQDPLFRQCVSTRSYTCSVFMPTGGQRRVTWTNTNLLLMDDGFDGIKTGTTKAAGCCLVASGRQNGDKLLVVIVGSDSNDSRYADARALFRWAWQKRRMAAK